MKNKTAAQIESPGRRAAAYWFVDGLPETAFGIVMLIFGIFGMVGWGFLRSNLWIALGFFVALLLFFAMIINHRRILGYMKARITYPRTGYARPPVDSPSKYYWPGKLLTLGLGAAQRIDENVSSFRAHSVFVFFFACWLLNRLPEHWIRPSWMLPLVMMVIAAIVYFWSRDDVRSYSWNTVLPLAVGGFITSAFELPPKAIVFAPMVIGGAWLLGIGCWTLSRYLQGHPKMDSGEAGRS